MARVQLIFLAILAIAGGIMCDNYFAFSIPFFTICFVLISAMLFIAFKPHNSDEEE
jgi:uncharacterized ion transporter superfamily protein YfcC